MPLRCLLFSSDEGTAQSIGQLLGELGIEAEHCPDAVQAVERVTSQIFNLVIVDWDDQPEASSLLNTARGKKASERPLNLAAVGNDASVPLALQAGANSILRKPISASQALGTLTTARDMLRAKADPPAPVVRVAAAAASASVTASVETPTFEARSPEADVTEAPEKSLHRGEFLQSGTTPSAHFVTESEVPHHEPVHASEIDPLNELEPTAASVRTQDSDDRLPERDSDEPRGLAWYLKARSAPVPLPPVPAAQGKVELISFSEAASFSGSVPAEPANGSDQSAAKAGQPAPEQEKRTEAALFAHIAGETPAEEEPKPRPNFNKFAALGVIALIFVVAFLEAPPSLWRPQAKSLVGRAALAARNWLNPQPVTTAPAPATHENFGRAGDEYKLPAAEAIPDASTDPNQIRVVPVVDPTIKPPKDPAAQPAPPNTDPKDNPDPASVQPGEAQPQGQDNTAAPNPVQENPQGQPATPPGPAIQAQPALTQPSGNSQTTESPAPPAHTAAPPATSANRDPMQPLPQRTPQVRVTSTVASNAIPSSLKSQMATSAPEASGNRPVESAMPSIEPVELPEATVRGLLLENPDPVYPDNARGQHGTVIVQVLIGRDGTVQDVKFQQGSLAFARSAIDAVRQWRFKPYTMNTRPVSVKTVVSFSFKPTA